MMRGHRSLLSAIAVAFVMLSSQIVRADDDEEPDQPDDTEQPAPKKKDPTAKGSKWKNKDGDQSGHEDESAPDPKVGEKKKKPVEHTGEDHGDSGGEIVGMATPDHDVTPPKVIFAGELLGASPVDSGNRDLFGMGGGVAVGAEYYVSSLLGIHGGLLFVSFAKDAGMDSTSWIAGHAGPRLHVGDKLFGATTHHDAWVDAHVTYGSSGGIKRPGFDLGAAIQWELSPQLRLGPVLRYEFGKDPRDANAQLITIGVALGYGGRTRTAMHIIGDRDGDGLADNVDKCPDENPGDRPDPKRAGCIAPVEKVVVDTDKDGVPDEDDWCPRIAQGDRPLKGQPGCPEKTLARVVDKKIEILQQIFFETDKATIKDESIPVLEAVAGILKHLDNKSVRIEGHTDDQGDDAYNLDLSKRRARAVAQWLVTNGGIAQERLQTEGYGKSRPLVSGPNADLSQNRRVEFVILDK